MKKQIIGLIISAAISVFVSRYLTKSLSTKIEENFNSNKVLEDRIRKIIKNSLEGQGSL